MKFTAKEIKQFFDAGLSAETIDKLMGMEEKAPAPTPAPAPAPSPAPAFDYDLIGKAIGESMKPVIAQMQAMAIGGTSQPKEKTLEDVIGEIINPPQKDDGK